MDNPVTSMIFDALDPVHGRGKELGRTKVGTVCGF